MIAATVKLLAVVLLCALAVFFAGHLVMADKRAQELDKSRLKAKVSDNFEKGFFAGARAVTSAMRLDTNTGKWSIELTNLLQELQKELPLPEP